jgi:hypothetical protein
LDEAGRWVRILRAIAKHMRSRSADGQATRAAREILGVSGEGAIAYRHSSTHSEFTPADPHPDNSDALRVAASYDLVRARRESRLRIVDHSRATDLEKSMVLIGSPTAEGLSRTVFGYSEVDGSQNGLRLTHPPVDLPYVWQLDPAEIDPGALATRYVRGRGVAARPNWRIIDTRTNKPFIPEVDNDGWLQCDYLVVTRLRNFLTRNAYDRGSYIMNFGGAHGTGTRALELLLRDESVLRRVAHELRGRPEAYQLLFRVSRLSHDPRTGTRARAIELLDAVKIEDTEERWRIASEIAHPGFHTWMSRPPEEDTQTLL